MSDGASPTGARSSATPWPVVASVLVMTIAALVLVGGWLLGSETLLRLHVTYAAMAPSTALCFLLIAGGLFWEQRTRCRRSTVVAVLRTVSLIVALVAVVAVIVVASGAASGIDALFWTGADHMEGGAMAPSTATCFLFAAASLYGLTLEPGAQDRFFVASATLGLLSSLVALVGFAFNAEALHTAEVFSPMALHTALAFLILFSGFLLVRPGSGWVGILTGPGTGSAGARRLFPIILLGPILLGLGALALTDAGLFDANFRLSLLAILMMALAVGAVLRNAVIENAAERRQTETLVQLWQALDDRDLLLREVHHRVKNNLQQVAALISFEAMTVNDAQARDAFNATSARVRTLGMVHQLLIASEKPSEVNFSGFLKTLCDQVATSLGADRRGIAVRVRAEPHVVDIDVAVSLGLLTNELLTNTFKHAYPAGGGGTLTVSFQNRPDGSGVLVIADDGVGGGGGELGGTGGRIIKTLLRQLNADMTIRSETGLEVIIDLPPNFGAKP